MAADNEGEVFDLVSADGRVIGQELRSVVHRKGLLHRAVYVWVFRASDGALLVQRRSAGKKIGPNQWDLSVAEHLQPGESYVQGAARGLGEELGIAADTSALSGPLAPTHRRELHAGEFHDVELVQSYRLDGYAGEVRLDEAEVGEAKWVLLPQLRAHVEAHPEQYTQWFLDEVRSLSWFDSQSGHLPATVVAAAAGAPEGAETVAAAAEAARASAAAAAGAASAAAAGAAERQPKQQEELVGAT